MAKWQNDLVLDAALDYISTNATEMYVCSGAGAPIDRAAAITASLIAAVTPTFQANADGDVSGRKLTVDAKADQAITATGDATHIALCSGTTLVYVTTCTTQSLSNGGTVTVPLWDVEFADVTP